MAAPSSKPRRLLAASGVGYTVLRPAVVYGKGVKGNIASLATLAKTPMPLPFAGLDNRRSLLALDNLVSAIAHVLESDAAANETFLVADAAPISVADLVGAMREGLGKPPHLVKVPARRGEENHEVVRPRGRLGARLGRIRHRSVEADGDRLAASRRRPMPASSR